MSFPLTSPTIGSNNWGTAVNNNWSTLNTAFGTSNPGSSYSGATIWGVQNATAPVIGQVGEIYIQTPSGVAAAASATWGNITSITLPAGDWLITGWFVTDNGANGLAANTLVVLSITTTSATGGATGYTQAITTVSSTAAHANYTISVPNYHVNISSSTTYYLNGQVTYPAGSPSYYGVLQAVRIR